MPRSSRHKSHKQSKHSSNDYSDSEEDVKMKDKSSKDENSTKVSRDPASGEKRKISSHARGGKEVKDPTGHGNGEVPEEYISSKRRKDKDDAGVGADRWNGGGDERGNRDKIVEKQTSRGESSKMESKSKEFSTKGESLRVDAKNKNRRHDGVGDDIEDILTPGKEDGRSRGESRKKSERDHSSRKEEKELKYKDSRLEKGGTEKILGRDTRRPYIEVRTDTDAGEKPVSQLGDLSEEKQSKRSRENTDYPVQGDSKTSDSQKVIDKRSRKQRDSSSDRGVLHDDFKENEERGLSARSNHKKDLKYKDKDRSYSDKYQDDGHKNDGQRYQDETKEDYKHWDKKYGEESEKDSGHRDDRHRGDGVKENRTKDEKYRESDKDAKKKDDNYRDATERYDRDKDAKKDDNYRDATERYDRLKEHRYPDDSERDRRRRDDPYRENGDKDERHRDERYYDDGDDRRRENKYKGDGDRENRFKEEKHREDNERGSQNKDSKQGDDIDRDRRMREAKYREDFATRDRSGDKSGSKHLADDFYIADHSRKSNAYEDSPIRDEPTSRSRDDQGKRRIDDREDYADVRSRNTKDNKFDAEKKTGSSTRMDSVSDIGRSTSRNAELELNSSYGKRHSRNSSTITSREHHRLPKKDEYKYRDYGYDDRARHSTTSTRDYVSGSGGYEKTLSRSLEKVDQKEDGHLSELSVERRLTSDVHSSPLKLFDKSPSSSTDRRQFGRSDVRQSIDIDESTQRSGGGYGDMKEYSGKELKESRKLSTDGFPGEDYPHLDVDYTSMSSPLSRNKHLSGSSKSFPHIPPLRTGGDSPLMSGSTEDDSRNKSNIRSKRSGDPNIGRIQGNAWRGVPSWPSPVANGFMSFPHAPPVGFHSILQPFPSPMFGIRPSMDMNIPGHYHISDPERFSGPVRPMGWHNQVDDSRPPLHAWDGNNAVYQEENPMYMRPGGDHSRNLPGVRGWDIGGDMWKGLSTNASFEMPSYEKENIFSQTANEPSGHSIQPSPHDLLGLGHQAVCSDANQSTYISEFSIAEDPSINLEDARDKIAGLPNKDDVPLYNVYLSRLDVSADLSDPELLKKCVEFIDMDPHLVSDVDNSKILLIEEPLATEAVSHEILSYSFTHLDDSFFQRAMSLYKKQKENFNIVIDGCQDVNVEEKSSDHTEINHKKLDSPTANDPLSIVDDATMLPAEDNATMLPAEDNATMLPAEDIATKVLDITLSAEDISTKVLDITLSAEDNATKVLDITLSAEDNATKVLDMTQSAEDNINKTLVIESNASDSSEVNNEELVIVHDKLVDASESVVESLNRIHDFPNTH